MTNWFPYSHHPHVAVAFNLAFHSPGNMLFFFSFCSMFGGEICPPLHRFSVQRARAVILSRKMKRPVTLTERRYCGGLFHSETIGFITGHDKKNK